MSITVLETIRLKEGLPDHISGKEADAELTPPVISIASTTATLFCDSANLGDFEAVCGFDCRGGFLIKHDAIYDELTRTNFSKGWNIGYDTCKQENHDSISEFICGNFEEASRIKNYFLHLPLPSLLQFTSQTAGFQFLGLRHKTGKWVEPIDQKSSVSKQTIFNSFYPFARILFSQDLPVGRLYIKASKGHALCWRSNDRTCGIAAWKGNETSEMSHHIQIIDALALAFAN